MAAALNCGFLPGWGDARDDRLDVTTMRQLDKDVVLVAYDKRVVITNLDGQLKSAKCSRVDFRFACNVEHCVCLSDSILAFHRHGVEVGGTRGEN